MEYCVAYRTKVKLGVFNSKGKMVRSLLDEEKEAGTYEIEFDVTDLPGGGLGPPEGIYVYNLQAGDFTATKKMLLLKHSST